MFDKKLYVKLPNNTVHTIIGHNPILGVISRTKHTVHIIPKINCLDVSFEQDSPRSTIDYDAIEYLIDKDVKGLENIPSQFVHKTHISMEDQFNTLVCILNRINNGMVPVVSGYEAGSENDFAILLAPPRSFVKEASNLACMTLITSVGNCNFENHIKLSNMGFKVKPLEEDNSGWLIGGIHTNKGAIVYM